MTLFRDFVEDRRISMEIYADGLASNLGRVSSGRFVFDEYRPTLAWPCRSLRAGANDRMRTARYWCYPRQVRKLRRSGICHILDHGYAHLMSVLDPGRTVLTVHDLIPILAGRGLIEGVRRSRRSWLAEWTARYYRKAARIIAISENTKRDLVTFCDCDPGRIEVVYYGLDPAFRPFPEPVRKRCRESFGIPEDARAVLITGREFYKNQETSLAVMEALEREFGSPLRLVRIGVATPEWREARRVSRFRGNVIEIQNLESSRMPELYNAVDCVLFPSWYEGFGLPPVEAMACGTPAVTSNAASLPEAVGDAAAMAAPGDVEGLAEGVRRVLQDARFRVAQIEKGIAQARRFRWAENAQRTLEIYEQLMERQSS